MNGWGIWAGLATLIALMFISALNLALRMPSRTRLAEQFEKKRRNRGFEDFVAVRTQYVLATAILRFALTLAVMLFALDHVGIPTEDISSPTPGAAFAIALVFVLVFGVAIPNAWANYTGEWLIVCVLPLLQVMRLILFPLVVALEVFDPFVRRLAGVPVRDAQSYADELEQEILSVVSEGERHGAVDEEEKEMIESVIELTDTRVEEIMKPRTDMVALAKETDLDSVLQIVRKHGHSRIPVYDETIDTILGVLYVKDLLRRDSDTPFSLTSIMRDALFIPESKLLRELLREFQTRKIHIAIVLDEYGGTAGLVTIEDILEELVGEIADEYETTGPAELIRIDDRTVEVDARMRIDDLNDELNLGLSEEEDYETIAGLVFSALGRIPKAGERLEHANLDIEVLTAEPRRILRLRLTIRETADAGQEQANQNG
ncbi:MAG: HlyC/CorC family transporter [Phycisphaerales bacterium]|nr:MAG: HlyC/CorC family transporter [Phycisphaerales bacterium]